MVPRSMILRVVKFFDLPSIMASMTGDKCRRSLSDARIYCLTYMARCVVEQQTSLLLYLYMCIINAKQNWVWLGYLDRPGLNVCPYKSSKI